GASGTSVTLDGVNLSGATEVRFNTAAALFTIVSPFRLIATVPLEATSGPITVTTAFGNTVTFAHFIVAPRVLGFFPTNAAPGAVVIIEGANFTGATSVRFSERNAPAYSVVAQNQIHATVPSGASSGPISVTTLAGTGASAANFVVTGSEPILTEFFPTNGVPGTVVTIHGRNFTGATGVKFNGANAASFFVTAPTQISATVPLGASTGPITVSTISGTGASLAPFVVTTAPVIVDFTPAVGPPGAIVVIEGANFLGATGVKFNGTAAASFSVTASTQIRAVVPSGATTGPISVVTPKGAGSSVNGFAVVTQPVIVEFAPTNGPSGTIVTIDGVNFSGLAAVQFGGVKAGVFTLVSPTQIRSTTPAGAITGPITVATALGAGASTNHFFVTASQPVITGFSPASGGAGVTVILYGLNFAGATAVRFNGAGANFS
ncbi:MAG: IPT/TIG domain FG-GAP repeat-containing protein, partial [Gammaproteobacteria bacterium]